MQQDNLIGSDTISGLSAGAWDVASAKWEVDLAPGEYCLIAELVTGSETSANEAQIASDNNKVQ